MRFIILLLLVFVVVWLIRRALRGPARTGDVQQNKPVDGELVRCAHCAILLPRSEARLAEGVVYCSEEHARLGKR
jgi:uncharacterized protein